MGQLTSRFRSNDNNTTKSSPMRIILRGLDRSGKTTLLYKLKGESITIENSGPTIGFNMEIIKSSGTPLHVIEMGGRARIREMWPSYYGAACGIIFVVDSSDRERLGDMSQPEKEYPRGAARDEFMQILAEEKLMSLPILIYANKQDLTEAMSVDEIAKFLGLTGLTGKRQWHVQGCSATNGEGLFEGLQWLSKHAARRPETSQSRNANSNTSKTISMNSHSANDWPVTKGLQAQSPTTANPTVASTSTSPTPAESAQTSVAPTPLVAASA